MRLFCIFFCVMCALCACQRPAQETDPAAQDGAARIGSVIITQADVDHAITLLDDKAQAFANTSIGRQNLVQILTREKLIYQDARATGFEQEPSYQEALAQKRAELDGIYEQFAQDALVRTWYEKNGKELEPSEAQTKQYYNQYPYEMTLQQIIVDNAQTADQVLRTLKASPGRWKEMSRQFSIAPKQLQTLTFMPGEYLENLEAVAANSAIGKVQGFFKTPQGFHIIKKTGENRLTYEQAAPRIKQILKHQRLDELLDTLKTQYEVIIYDQNQ